MKELKLVAKGGLLSLTGDAVNYTLSYVFLFIASHLLGAGLLGAFYWAISIISLAGEFADCGTGQGIIYFGPKYEAEKGENRSFPIFNFVLRFTLTNALILGTLLFMLAPLITGFSQKPELTNLIRFLAVTLPFSVFWPVAYKYFVARFQIVPGILYGDIARPMIRVLLLLILIAMGLKSFALAGTELLVGVILLLAGVILLIKLWGKGIFREKLSLAEKKRLLLYSIPFLPMNIARGDRMVLIITGFFLAVADIGVLGVALKVAAISQVILTGLNFVFRPMVAKLYAAKDFVTLKSIYRSITRWIFILTLPLSFLFIFYPAAVLGLFGDKFSSGAAALTIIAIGYLFEYGTSATQVIINMTGKSWLSLMNQLISFAAIFAGALVLIPRMGMNGAAVAVAVGIILVNLLRLWQSYRIVGFTPFSLYLGKPIAALIVSGVFIFLLFPPSGHYHPIQLLYLAVTMLGLYCVTTLLLGLNSEDRDLLRAAKAKLYSL